MFRIGGMAHEQRTGYMGGGMNGVMSGIMPTQPDAGLNPRMGLAGGGNIGGGIISGMSMGNRTGFQTPNIVGQGSSLSGSSYGTRGVPIRLPATTPGVPALAPQYNTTTSRPLMERLGKGFRNLIGNKGIISNLKNLTKGGVNAAFKYGTPAVQATAGTLAIPAATIAGFSYMNYPVYPKGHPQEGEFMSKEEAAEVLSETGAATNMATGKGVQAGSAGDLSGEAAMFDLETGDYGNKPYATKLDFERPEVVKNSNEALGLLPEKDKSGDDLDKEGGEKNIKDEESALMKAYKEYAPIFEKELGVSDDDTKKQLYLQLAKFGAGVAAQPGGDLVGAIGKAALPAIEGAGETVKEQSTAKRQAKLLALQTAISEGKPGPIATAIKDIAKIYKVSNKEAAAIYEKWNVKNSAGNPVQEKRLETLATKIGVNPDGFIRNINKLLKSEDADLIGKFNKKLPMNDGIPDPDKMVDKEYYIGLGGELYRVDKSVEPADLLEPGDAGFKDSKKEK
jgi:hypothetical protein